MKDSTLHVKLKWTRGERSITARVHLGQLAKRVGIKHIQNFVEWYTLRYKKMDNPDSFFAAIQDDLTEQLIKEGYLVKPTL